MLLLLAKRCVYLELVSSLFTDSSSMVPLGALACELLFRYSDMIYRAYPTDGEVSDKYKSVNLCGSY